MSDTHRRLGSNAKTLVDPSQPRVWGPEEHKLPEDTFVGEVVISNPEHVEGEGRSQKLRPLVTVRVMGGVELPPGTILGTSNRPRQESEIVDVSDGQITLKIVKGMGRGRTPAPNAVPTVGEVVTYFRAPEVPKTYESVDLDDGTPTMKVVTVNQLVAYNLAYWRKHGGMTQEELGQRIAEYNGGEPWSKANVSAAERTWDGTRVRRFDADDIYMLARFFKVPIHAMLMPPEDASDVMYVIGDPDAPPGNSPHTSLEEYMLHWSDSGDKNGESLKSAYAQRAWRLYGQLYDTTPEHLQENVVEVVADARRALTGATKYIKELQEERELLIDAVMKTQKMVEQLLKEGGRG